MSEKQPQLSVLIAEDEAMIAEVLCWTLEDEGFHVVVAGDGEAALVEFKKTKFALLVTDIRMPGIDGWTLASRIRKVDPVIPVLFISGYSPKAPELPASSRFLQKPFVPEKFLEVVGQLI